MIEACGKTVTETACEAGIGRTSLYNYLSGRLPVPQLVMFVVGSFVFEAELRRLIDDTPDGRPVSRRRLKALLAEASSPLPPPEPPRPPQKPVVARVEKPRKRVYVSKTYDREVKYSPPTLPFHPHLQQAVPSGGIRTVIVDSKPIKRENGQ